MSSGDASFYVVAGRAGAAPYRVEGDGLLRGEQPVRLPPLVELPPPLYDPLLLEPSCYLGSLLAGYTQPLPHLRLEEALVTRL